ncbi:hypothetical protein THAOC_14792, partial [Thalassiosira oceanica]
MDKLLLTSYGLAPLLDYTDERLFAAFAPLIASKLDECSEQDLANIAWAYSVENAPQDLFNEGYASAIASKEKDFGVESPSPTSSFVHPLSSDPRRRPLYLVGGCDAPKCLQFDLFYTHDGMPRGKRNPSGIPRSVRRSNGVVWNRGPVSIVPVRR